jgi:phospholipase D-like protein
VKLLAEILVSIFIHPLAFVLAVVNIVQRQDLKDVEKIIWIIVSFFWGIGPILYVLVGRGELW